MVRTRRSAIEEKWEVKIDVTHSVWPWIAEQARFLWHSQKESCGGGSLGKMTCMWEDGVYLGIKATHGDVIVENRNEKLFRSFVHQFDTALSQI